MARTPSVHINIDTLLAVRDGKLPQSTPVGTGLDGNGDFSTAFIHFEKDTGVARVSEKGALRLNLRPQVKRQAASLTTADGKVVTAEEIAAWAAAQEVKQG